MLCFVGWAVLFFCLGYLVAEGIRTWERRNAKLKETEFVALNRRRRG